MNFAIEYYQEKNGSEPVKTYLDYLKAGNPILWKSTIAKIEKIKDRQNHKMPITEPLGEKVFGLRTRANITISRILFCFRPGKIVELLHGFTKTTEKIHPADLKLAISRMKASKYEKR